MDMNIVAAMTNAGRGIGHHQRLPWPFLKRDYEFYIQLSQARKDPGRKNVHIKGRLTWDCTKGQERTTPNAFKVIVSSKLRDGMDPNIDRVVSTFQEAVDYVTTGPKSKEIENIWIMGGTKIYEAAINHPACKRIYLTRVFGNFEADAFFPAFEDKFRKISDPAVSEEVHEDNGVTFQFEVYERMEGI